MSLSYRLYRFASGIRHRLPRLLTPAGQLLLAGTAAAASASFDMERTVAYQAFGLQFCVLITALLSRRLFRFRFDARRELPRLASVGQPFQYAVRIRNLTVKPGRDLEVFDELADPRPNATGFQDQRSSDPPLRPFRIHRPLHRTGSPDFRRALSAPGRMPVLQPGGSSEVTLTLLPIRRGPLRFEAVSLARTDPLGLARAFVRTPLPDTVLVLPKRYALPPIDFGAARRHQPGGVALASNIGAAEEFLSLRDYRPGDPLRQIHWRSWARLGRPIVREFQDEFFPRYALLLDTMATAAADHAFEEAVAVAASFACTFDTQESLLDLLFVGAQAIRITTGRSLGRMEQALEVLASVQRQPRQSFDALHRLVLEHAPQVCGCICVFLHWDEPRQELVRQLRAHGVPVLVLLVLNPGLNANLPDEEPGLYPLRPDRMAEDLARIGRPA